MKNKLIRFEPSSFDVNSVKLATAEIVVNDPIFLQLDFGVRIGSETLVPDIANNCYLEITRNVASKKNPEAIKKQVAEIFTNYFSTTNDNLGKLISITEITNSINAIDGVLDIKTVRMIGNTMHTTPGVSFLALNPVYPFDDINILAQDTQLPYFKFPFINDSVNFIDKIKVITPSLQLLEKEF
jgi:hypothetical protein